MPETGEPVTPESSAPDTEPVAEERPSIHRTLNVDSSMSDRDSAVGSETTSSSVTDYRIENGRRYHAHHDGAYYLPNDEDEINRLDLQHIIWRMSLDGGLYISPLPQNITNALDLGTGTGIWAIEFAREHPNAQVIGVDLSPIQPSFVPDNCSFIVDNIEEEWVYRQKFDFIHARALVLGVHDWPKLIRQAWNYTKPGGWIELQEIQASSSCDDGSAAPDSPTMQWSRHVLEATRKVGLNPTAAEQFPKLLEEQGYINLHTRSSRWAIGGWPKDKKEKEIGRWMLENLLKGLEGATLALFTRILGWTKEAVEEFAVGLRKQLKDPNTHIYTVVTVHSAQKPLGSES